MIAPAKPELRVLQVLPNLAMGGAETWIMAVLRYLARHSQDLPVTLQSDILITGGKKTIFDDEAAVLGARLHYLRYSRRTLVSFILNFRRLLNTRQFHAIHDHQEYGAGWHFLWGMGCLPAIRVAHVHTPPTDHFHTSAARIHRWSVKLGFRFIRGLASHILGTSRATLHEYGFELQELDSVNCEVCHCGFDTSCLLHTAGGWRGGVCKEFNWPSTARIVLFAGRLDSGEKNFPFAFDVVVKCVARNPAVRLLVAGGGEVVRREFENRARAMGLYEHIRFLGVRQDIPRLMKASDLLLFPSIFEGLGMVVVEAQAAGLRVLAADSVPTECVVVPELVRFLSLRAGADRWAEETLQCLGMCAADPLLCNDAVRRSPFSIEHSVSQLLSIYTGKAKNAACAHVC